MPFVHLPFIFRSFDLLVASLLFTKGIERIALLGENWSVISAVICMSLEFDSSIICHVLVYSFGSFLLQDMFSSLQVFAFEDQNMTAFMVNVLLTCILNCVAGPGFY